MKKIAAITFHGAHNFGSMLQTYALQSFVEKIAKEKQVDISYSVLNYRTPEQIELYQVYKKNISFKNIVKNVLALRYNRMLKVKHSRFEQFLEKYLKVTAQYSSEKELKKANLYYDYYISGSDQLWNIRAGDFEWAYLLPFVEEGKKISYAASLGPLPIDWSLYDGAKYAQLLNTYSAVSVREAGSVQNIAHISPISPQIHLDPTMLLAKEEWNLLTEHMANEHGEYIFFYCLETSKEILQMVADISSILGLKVVISKYCGKVDYVNSFIKDYAAGPLEFLNLIKNAKLVISASFHGTVFSILMNKPFFSVNGLEDNRMSNILKIMKLEARSIGLQNYKEKLGNFEAIDFAITNQQLEQERQRSKEYLCKELEL